MIAADRAPGIMRDYWGFRGWAQHDEAVWGDLVDEADERLAIGLDGMPRIVGTDLDESVIAIARENAKRAGFADEIVFEVADAARLGDALNAPAGSRLGIRSAQDKTPEAAVHLKAVLVS